jgi:hypothetical protein
VKFRYVGDDVREFPSIPATCSPGDVLESESNPLPRFFVEVIDGDAGDVVVGSVPVVEVNDAQS